MSNIKKKALKEYTKEEIMIAEEKTNKIYDAIFKDLEEKYMKIIDSIK